MIKIYVGSTGCGKTYQAFHRLGKKTAIYGAPCRQLVYETACKYGNINCGIRTSDIKIGNSNTKLCFCTYECISRADIRKTDVLIIDEAHFICDKERGHHICDLIYFAQKIGKEVVLLSATMPVEIKGAKIIKLPPRGKQFSKREVSLVEALERAEAGVPTLYFHKYKDDCGSIARKLGLKGGSITAETSVSDRVKIVELYNSGKISIIEATNAMAQGVNVPCENLINEYNSWDDPAVIIQKLGRLGRTGVTKEGVDLTYFIGYDEVEINSFLTCFEHEKPIIEVKPSRKVIKEFINSNPPTQEEKLNLKKQIEKKWLKY